MNTDTEMDTPFPNEEAEHAYIQSIAPDKSITCPITQECFTDPVVAEDGHTYEREAILRWFHHMGRTRSPVTNALLGDDGDEGSLKVSSNLVVLGLALRHKEKRGEELLKKCHVLLLKYVQMRKRKRYEMDGVFPADGGARIRGLIDSGADLSMRYHHQGRGGDGDVGHGKTAIWMLVEANQLELAQYIFHSGASVIPTIGSSTCADAIKEIIAGLESVAEERKWKAFLDAIQRRQKEEEETIKRKERAREQDNQEYRQEQQNRQRNARAREGADSVISGAHGLGRMEQGLGYFPTLSTLLFQEAIPPPSASIREEESKIKEVLDTTLMIVGGIVFMYLLFS